MERGMFLVQISAPEQDEKGLTARMNTMREWLDHCIGRLDARARICVMLLDIYERLPRNGLNSGLTFNLPLTQEQIADHLGLTLVHVNRTLRRLREQRIVLIERQTVIILDLDRLRECAEGLPHLLSFRAQGTPKTP